MELTRLGDNKSKEYPSMKRYLVASHKGKKAPTTLPTPSKVWVLKGTFRRLASKGVRRPSTK